MVSTYVLGLLRSLLTILKAGTMRSAELKSSIPASLFPARPEGKKKEGGLEEKPRMDASELPHCGGAYNQPIDLDDLLDGMDVEDILEAGKSPYLTL